MQDGKKHYLRLERNALFPFNLLTHFPKAYALLKAFIEDHAYKDVHENSFFV